VQWRPDRRSEQRHNVVAALQAACFQTFEGGVQILASSTANQLGERFLWVALAAVSHVKKMTPAIKPT
jgi:hypothetical protein